MKFKIKESTVMILVYIVLSIALIWASIDFTYEAKSFNTILEERKTFKYNINIQSGRMVNRYYTDQYTIEDDMIDFISKDGVVVKASKNLIVCIKEQNVKPK